MNLFLYSLGDMNANMFDGEYRKLRYETRFPIDELKCFEMGRRLVKKAAEKNLKHKKIQRAPTGSCWIFRIRKGSILVLYCNKWR